MQTSFTFRIRFLHTFRDATGFFPPHFSDSFLIPQSELEDLMRRELVRSFWTQFVIRGRKLSSEVFFFFSLFNALLKKEKKKIKNKKASRFLVVTKRIADEEQVITRIRRTRWNQKRFYEKEKTIKSDKGSDLIFFFCFFFFCNAEQDVPGGGGVNGADSGGLQ